MMTEKSPFKRRRDPSPCVVLFVCKGRSTTKPRESAVAEPLLSRLSRKNSALWSFLRWFRPSYFGTCLPSSQISWASWQIRRRGWSLGVASTFLCPRYVLLVWSWGFSAC